MYKYYVVCGGTRREDFFFFFESRERDSMGIIFRERYSMRVKMANVIKQRLISNWNAPSANFSLVLKVDFLDLAQ